MHDSHTLQKTSKNIFAQANTHESISAAAMVFVSRKLQGTMSCWKCNVPGVNPPWKGSLIRAILPLHFISAPVLDLDVKKKKKK